MVSLRSSLRSLLVAVLVGAFAVPAAQAMPTRTTKAQTLNAKKAKRAKSARHARAKAKAKSKSKAKRQALLAKKKKQRAKRAKLARQALRKKKQPRLSRRRPNRPRTIVRARETVVTDASNSYSGAPEMPPLAPATEIAPLTERSNTVHLDMTKRTYR